jgi:tetratricopeptide (TPR) repeat protein
LSPERKKEVLRHLLTPCESCLAEAPPLLCSERARREFTADEEAAYEVAIERAARIAIKHDRHLRRQQAQARKILKLLRKGDLLTLDKILPSSDPLARMDAFLARSWELRHEDPQVMVHFAWLALGASKQLDPRQYGVEQVLDFQTRAQAELGNAYRAANRPQEASNALARARHLFERGSREKLLGIRLVELEASLSADLRNFGRAAFKLLEAFEFHCQNGNIHLAGRMLVKIGLYSGYAGNFEQSIRLLKKSLGFIDPKQDPMLACAAAHNLILSLADSGRFREAKKLRVVYSGHLVNTGGRINEIKFRVLEARIDAGLGNYPRAESIFREAIEGLDQAGLPILSSIERLNLSATFLAQGKSNEAAAVAFEAADIFTLLDIRREALEAMLLLRNAFEMKKATLEMIEEVAGFLRRIDLDPTLRFEGRAWEGPDNFGPG